MKLKNKNSFWQTRAALIAAFSLAGLFSGAQSADNSAPTDFSSFQIIAQRNIFDPNRYPRMSRTSRRTRAGAPAFSLAGTMDYRKGMFAFFNGTTSDYRKALQTGGTIAGYTVAKITLAGVELQAAGKKIEMKVGEAMRQESGNVWRLSAPGELQAAEAETENAGPASNEMPAANDDSSSEPNDVLKKLMQQREQELK